MGSFKRSLSPGDVEKVRFDHRVCKVGAFPDRFVAIPLKGGLIRPHLAN